MCLATDTVFNLVLAGDRQPWGFRTEAQDEVDDHSVWTTSVPDLLERHALQAFDFVKIDIEFAEYQVFGQTADLEWLKENQLLAMEIHGQESDRSRLVDNITSRGPVGFTHGEYTFFTTPTLASTLGIDG